MVKEIEHKKKRYYQCEACEMYYERRELAEKCEKHCNEKNACDTEIIKHAVQLKLNKNDNTCDIDCKEEGESKCC